MIYFAISLPLSLVTCILPLHPCPQPRHILLAFLDGRRNWVTLQRYIKVRYGPIANLTASPLDL